MCSFPDTNGRIYGLDWQYDKANDKYCLHFDGVSKYFGSYDEMHTFIHTTDYPRFKINKNMSVLECGDIVEIESELASGRGEIIINKRHRGLILISIDGLTYGLAYNDINEVKVIKKNAEDLAV